MNTLEAALESRTLEGLNGHIEDLHLEAKQEPYDLDSANGRFELAKDVSAFANSEGGHLVIGAVTTRSAERDEDVISSLNLLPREAFPVDRYRGIIAEHTYPGISGIEVVFVPNGDGPDGLGIIRVPPQPADSWPFLILRVAEEGDYLRQIVAGYAERKGSQNEPLTPKSLQQRFKKGSDTLAQRLSRMEDKLELLVERSDEVVRKEAPGTDVTDARISAALEDAT